MDTRLPRSASQCSDELAATPVPVERRLRKRLRDHRLDRGRDLGNGTRQLRRWRVQVCVQHGDLGRPVKRSRPCEALVQYAGQGVDVGAGIKLAAFDLLGCGVLDRPDEAAGAGGPVRGELLDDPRSEEHTSELQSRENLVCRLLLEKKKKKYKNIKIKTNKKKKKN